MIVSLTQSIPDVVKSRPEVSISGEWSGIKKIHDCILNLKGTAFKVRAVIADNHSVNVFHIYLTHTMGLRNSTSPSQ